MLLHPQELSQPEIQGNILRQVQTNGTGTLGEIGELMGGTGMILNGRTGTGNQARRHGTQTSRPSPGCNFYPILPKAGSYYKTPDWTPMRRT